jgi:hypothetical protein
MPLIEVIRGNSTDAASGEGEALSDLRPARGA